MTLGEYQFSGLIARGTLMQEGRAAAGTNPKRNDG